MGVLVGLITGLLQSHFIFWVPAIELGIFLDGFNNLDLILVFGAINDRINDLKEGRKQH